MELGRLGNIQPPSIDCPVTALFLPQFPDKVVQEKSKCIFCERDFVGPFTVRLIHLLGNTKGVSGGRASQVKVQFRLAISKS